ncbi:MAG: MBL fold metallo-hydrolase [Aquificaceae bacterium]
MVVDPGADAEFIKMEVGNSKLKAIVCTHGHIDHVGQVRTLKSMYDTPFYMHRLDIPLMKDPIWPGFERQIKANLPCSEPDLFLEEGEELTVGRTRISVLHTPGHTQGHCCLYSQEEKLLIAGDLLFRGSVGRWDLPGGSLEDLRNSLRRVFGELPDDTLVVCGHYQETSIGYEKRFNPYLRDIL